LPNELRENSRADAALSRGAAVRRAPRHADPLISSEAFAGHVAALRAELLEALKEKDMDTNALLLAFLPWIVARKASSTSRHEPATAREDAGTAEGRSAVPAGPAG
jgi:hypothetical protein